MIYNVNSPYFQSFLSNSKKQPSAEEIVEALRDLKKKKAGQTPEELAAALRTKYPTWVLDDVDWVDLAKRCDAPPAEKGAEEEQDADEDAAAAEEEDEEA
mmetsp:Transcript_14551/g.44091  ORF Transcript_14551/g.44091 Transcript_14551/m.44091 type:complete len:100 (-) Transcript_14551:177-476(-)